MVATGLWSVTPEAVRRRAREGVKKRRLRSDYLTSLVPATILEEKYRLALMSLIDRAGKDSVGPYLDFGVCRGTSMLCMYRAMQKVGLDTVKLIGFDSFEGLPGSAAFDDGGVWRPGQFDSSYALTRKSLHEAGVDWRRVMLVKGWFSDSLTETFVREQKLEKASVIMVDCDLYLSAKEALTFCAPLIVDRAIIFLDDWDAAGGSLAANHLGERRAFEEFLAENPALVAEERADLKYRTADPTAEAYSRVFEVARLPLPAAESRTVGQTRSQL